MLFGVAGHAAGEALATLLHRRAIDKKALVEAVYLVQEVYCVCVGFTSCRTLFASVATQHKNIVYARQLQVDEHILGLLERITVAQNMRHHRHTETVLNGGGHCHGTGRRRMVLRLYVPSPISVYTGSLW